MLCFFLLCFTSQSAIPQNDRTGDNRVQDKYFSEELHVVADRDLYIAGEKVLLKVFSFGRMTHWPSAVSSVAYVTLLDRSENPVLQTKIEMHGSSGSGFIDLPDTLGTGNYSICTATRWMQNFSSKYYSYNTISVVNPFRNIDRINLPRSSLLPDSVVFFPEGGNLIAGIETKVGFRCYDKKGNPVDISATVTDVNRKVMTPVFSTRRGTGFFSISPQDTLTLYLQVSADSLHHRSFPLPVILSSGVSLALSEDEEHFRLKILNKTDNPGDARYFLTYEPLSGNTEKREISPGRETNVIFDRRLLPYGPAGVSIRDDKGSLSARRWVYNQALYNNMISVNSDKTEYSTREKVKIEVSVTDVNGNAVKGDLVLSVARAVASVSKTGVLPPGSLTSYPGLLEPGTRQADINEMLIIADHDMTMSRGLQVSAGQMKVPEPDGHVITGVIRRTDNGPLKEESVSLSFVGPGALNSFTKTDSAGRFYFTTSLHGTREAVIVPLSADIDDYYVELDNPFPSTFSQPRPEPFFIDTCDLDEINKAIISYQVRKIYEPFFSVYKQKPVSDEGADFYGDADYTTDLSRYIELSSLREVFKEIVPGVITRERKGKAFIILVYKNRDQVYEMSPLVLVDGVPVNDHSKVLDISPSEIGIIDVLNSRYYVGTTVLNGIVDITTARGDLTAVDFEKPLFRQEFDALQPLMIFSSPDYSVPSDRESRIPDFRNTLYWDPDIITNDMGRAEIEFYTSDEAGEYVITVEGFSSSGRYCKATAGITVREK